MGENLGAIRPFCQETAFHYLAIIFAPAFYIFSFGYCLFFNLATAGDEVSGYGANRSQRPQSLSRRAKTTGRSPKATARPMELSPWSDHRLPLGSHPHNDGPPGLRTDYLTAVSRRSRVAAVSLRGKHAIPRRRPSTSAAISHEASAGLSPSSRMGVGRQVGRDNKNII